MGCTPIEKQLTSFHCTLPFMECKKKPTNPKCIPQRYFRVLQVVDGGAILRDREDIYYSRSPLFFIDDVEGVHYYDDLNITIPSDKCAVIIDTYQYYTQLDFLKTIPVIRAEEKYLPIQSVKTKP